MLNIFAFGSGYIEFGIMQAIAQMFSGNQMNVLFASMMALGGVMVAVMTLISGYDRPGSHLTLAKYLLGAMFVYAVLIVPRVTVHIEDTVINTQSNAYVVTGVPFGIGGIMSLFSNIQMDLTQLVETNFSTPQSIDLTNAGMGLSLTSENLADNITISDPYLKRDFTQFTYNCIMPGMSAAGGIDMFDLDMAGAATDNSPATYNSNTAASFWSVVSAYTSGAGANEITTWYSGNGTVTGAASGGDYPQGLTTTCGQETTWMNTAMEYYIDNDAGPALAGSLGETWSQFSTEYGQINSSVYNMSNGATSQFEQMALTNEFSNAVIDSAKLAGLNANSVAYGTAMAQENMNNSFLISGVMASQYLPVAYGIISSLVMAFSVILLLLLFLPTGVNYLKMYFELLMFITVWPPLMAIYNYITDLIIQHNSVSLAGEGFSILTAHSYSTFTSSYLGWVGYMSWSIPMLAYALVTGSTYAMVATLSSVDSAGKSSASAGAKVASTGDLSLGNDSLNNYNANKLNSVRDISTGTKRNYYNTNRSDLGTSNTNGPVSWNSSLNGNSSQLTDNASGNVIGMKGDTATSVSDKNLSGNITNGVTAGRQEAYSKAKSNERTFGKTWNSTMAHSAQYMNQFGSSLDSGERKQFSADNKKSFMEAVNGDKSLSASQKQEIIARFQASAKGGIGDFGAGFEAIQSSGLSAEKQSSLSSKYTHDLGQTVSNSGSVGFSQKSVNGATLSDTLNATKTASENYSESAKQVKSLSDSISKSKNVSGTVAKNAVLGYINHFNKDRGYTTANGYSQEQIETLDDGELNRLNQNSAPLEQYVANNPDILKAENAVPNGSDIKSVPSKPQAMAKINSNHNFNKDIVKSHNPYKYNNNKSSQQGKTLVNELQKKSSQYKSAHTTTKNTPFNKLTPEQKTAYIKQQERKGHNGAINFVPDLAKFLTLGIYDDLTGNLKGASQLGKNVIGDLPKLHLNSNPNVSISKYHPGKLKILDSNAYKLQKNEYGNLTGGGSTGFKNITNNHIGMNTSGKVKKTFNNLNNKLRNESPFSFGKTANKRSDDTAVVNNSNSDTGDSGNDNGGSPPDLTN